MMKTPRDKAFVPHENEQLVVTELSNDSGAEETEELIDYLLEAYEFTKCFDWKKLNDLERSLKYIDKVPSEKRKYLMQIMSGKLLAVLDSHVSMGSEEDIHFLFRVKHVILKIWNDGSEADYTNKLIIRHIGRSLKDMGNDKLIYLQKFFEYLPYNYTLDELKKCKNRIIKENHPDNGGSGDMIQHIQEIYKLFAEKVEVIG